MIIIYKTNEYNEKNCFYNPQLDDAKKKRQTWQQRSPRASDFKKFIETSGLGEGAEIKENLGDCFVDS